LRFSWRRTSNCEVCENGVVILEAPSGVVAESVDRRLVWLVQAVNGGRHLPVRLSPSQLTPRRLRRRRLNRIRRSVLRGENA
jgi:hypothetical protein